MIQNPTPEFSNPAFSKIVGEISDIGKEWHAKWLLPHVEQNSKRTEKSVKELASITDPYKKQSAIVVCGGPSLYRRRTLEQIKESGYRGTLVAIDASFAASLRRNIIPDYVLSLDPHETRVVRWFGDPEIEEHLKHDDYFLKQDLDVEFRKNNIAQNQETMDLINRYGRYSKGILCTTAPENVVDRVYEAGLDVYWFNPIVDDPRSPESITRKMFELNRLACFNTGGNVGTAAWVFATSILGIPEVAVVGMDFGYYADLDIKMTQTYNELIRHLGSDADIESYFVQGKFPLTGEPFYTDPTYAWYRKNFLELSRKSRARTYNCTEGGMLFGDGIECIALEDFLDKQERTNG